MMCVKIYYTVYKITNIINNKIYIGAHKTKDLNDNYMGSGKKLLNAIKKYGIENFKKEILEIFDNSDEMFNLEKQLVNEQFVKSENTYNLKIGGDGGFDFINSLPFVLTEKRKISSLKNLEQANKKNLENKQNGIIGGFSNKFHSEETKNKMSIDRTGKNLGNENPNFGKISITKDNKNKMIFPNELDNYILNGWKKGQFQNKPDNKKENNPNFGKIWVTDGILNKLINSNDLEKNQELGFKKGRVFTNAK